MDASALVDWMARHRETLTWLAGGAATAADGLSVVVRDLLDRHASRPAPDSAPKAPGKPAGPAVSAIGGLAAGRDLRVGRDATINQNRIPPAAIGLVRWTDQGRNFGDNPAPGRAIAVFRAGLQERCDVPSAWSRRSTAGSSAPPLADRGPHGR